MSPVKKLALASLVLVLVPATAPAQEVFKEISSQRLEDILKNLKIESTKGDAGKGTTFYDYKTKNVMVRLWNYNGKDLMIDILFPKVDWDVVNKWNGTAKFSRARLNKDNKGVESTVLESNLDLAGGVTEDTVKHFIRTFDLEIDAWSRMPGTQGAVVAEEETYPNVSSEKLEKILQDLKIEYKKSAGKGNVSFYDFTRNNFKIRLTNFGGDDLMIDCIYPTAPLAKINQWNVKRSYIRAVLYPGGGMPYTALESNLDAAGGLSDSIIRYFITSFDAEVVAFDNHLKGK
jgi:hypothetical protein